MDGPREERNIFSHDTALFLFSVILRRFMNCRRRVTQSGVRILTWGLSLLSHISGKD